MMFFSPLVMIDKKKYSLLILFICFACGGGVCVGFFFGGGGVCLCVSICVVAVTFCMLHVTAQYLSQWNITFLV